MSSENSEILLFPDKKVEPRPFSFRFCTWGDLSSGKTVSLVREGLVWKHDFPQGKIYSNVPLFHVPFVPIRKAEQLFGLQGHLFLLLDELWHLADSRKSMSLINDVMSMLLLRSAKQGWSVGYSQQYHTQTDIRIRFITSLWIEPFLYENGLLKQNLFDKLGGFIRTVYYDASPLFKYYDTSADPYTLDLEDLKGCYEAYLERRRKGFKW